MTGNNPVRKPTVRVRIVGYLLLAANIVGVVEIPSRLVYAHAEWLADLTHWLFRPVTIDQPYKVLDQSNAALWRLNPGTEWTVRALRADMERRNAVIGIQRMDSVAASFGPDPGAVAFRVNADGFKGPELRQISDRPRILTLGDSCTFGTFFDELSYPRSLERRLAELGEPVEVVNGGVEGYSPRHVLYRLDEFAALDPDIVVLYIGWNALYYHPPATGAARYVRALWAWDRVQERIRSRRRQLAANPSMAMYSRSKSVDLADPLVAQMAAATPTFLDDVEEILERLSTSGTVVVVATLPGLFSTATAPSSKALEMGHLPSFTDNPVVLAALAERYNVLLRGLASEHGWKLVDLEAWARAELQPTDQYFFDSVHLTERGQSMLGEHLAAQLLSVAREVRRP